MRLVNLTAKSALANHRFAAPLGAGLVLVAVAWLWWQSNPLRRSDASIRAWVLKRTPLGISSEEVRTIAGTHGWLQRTRFVGTYSFKYSSHIQGELGHYWSLPLDTYVTVLWLFGDRHTNTTNRLTEVHIEKTKYGY